MHRCAWQQHIVALGSRGPRPVAPYTSIIHTIVACGMLPPTNASALAGGKTAALRSVRFRARQLR
eukprot:4981130-Alexandrium_andersonii.AAC.1